MIEMQTHISISEKMLNSDTRIKGTTHFFFERIDFGKTCSIRNIVKFIIIVKTRKSKISNLTMKNINMIKIYFSSMVSLFFYLSYTFPMFRM